MDAALKNQLFAIAPEFTNTPEPTLDAVYAEVSLVVDPKKFGIPGMALAVAHALTLGARAVSSGGQGGSAGPVTQMAEGQLSISFGSPNSAGYGTAHAFWSSTSYGARLWAMFRAKLVMPRNRMVGMPGYGSNC